MKIAFSAVETPKSGALVVGVAEGGVLTAAAAALDAHLGGALDRAIKASRFTGKKDQILTVMAPHGVTLGRVLLLGLGKIDALTAIGVEALGGAIVANLALSGESVVTVHLGDLPGSPLCAVSLAAHLAMGANLRSYRFTKYRTKLKDEQKPSLEVVTVLTTAVAETERAYESLAAIADGVFMARDLVTEPGNVIYPQTLAERAQTLAGLGVDVEVLDEQAMAKLGMGSLLGVGQGSVRPPRLIILRWNGNPDQNAAPVVVVGKGITFDTGGISLKPGAGMEEMKTDMGGSAVVIGLLKALAGRKAKANVVGIIAAAENMPDGNAQRPGDIVTSMSGQTIEVDNTDAEGRLVLADALWYGQDRFKPAIMIDLATLTGAILIALGGEHAGLFSNDDGLAQSLTATGLETGEKLWRLPMNDAYDRMIDSDVADMRNISGSREAGSIVGAVFLQRFVNGTKWAHLDIAGTTWSKKDLPLSPKGATGFGIRLLNTYIEQHYEAK